MFLLLSACAADRALLSAPVTLTPAQADFVLESGVEISLTGASLTVSSLRLESPAETAWRRRSLIPAAHAHPGHDFAGAVAGELIGTWTLDLLGESVSLGEAACYEGEYATARLEVLPEPGVQLDGTATVDGEVRDFSFSLAPDQEITGIPFAATLSADAPPSAVLLSVDLAHALSYADWHTDSDGVLTTADGALENTVLFGMVSTPTYTLSLEN